MDRFALIEINCLWFYRVPDNQEIPKFRDIFRDCQIVRVRCMDLVTGSANSRGWSIGEILGFREIFSDCCIGRGDTGIR